MRSIAFAISLLIGIPAMAQLVPPSPSPSDTDILQARAQAAEAQANYLSTVLRRVEAENKTRAQWWADYVAGLKAEPK